MNMRKFLSALAIFLVFFTGTAGWENKDARRSGASDLFAFSPDAAGTPDVRVVVRFAKARILPSASARVVKEIGYGTMLRVLGESGDYLQVASLNTPLPPGAEPWFVLRSDVEPVHADAAPAPAENRTVTFAPAGPIAGQMLLFTARNFRTPSLLKWDMGDGTALTSGSQIPKGQDATLAYAYASAGQYLVKVFDDGGDTAKPPVTARVTVTASPRSLQIDPESPRANQAVVITALNFRTPEKIAWDLGDGTEIQPGAGPDVLMPSFQVSHVYKNAGTYLVKAYDVNGDKSQPPLTLAIQIGNAPPAEVFREPVVAAPSRMEPAPAGGTPAPRRDRYPLIKIGPYAGYFQPKDTWFKQIYGSGDVIYGARLAVHVWQGLYFWLSASQYKVTDTTTFTKDKTTLTLLPVSAFLRYHLGRGSIMPYAGIGLTIMNFKEETEFIGNHKGSSSNVSFEAGCELKMNRHFSFDFGVRFDRMKYQPENPDLLEVDLGGLQFGMALLVSF